MPDCSATQVLTVIIDIWMVVENVKKLGIAEKFSIYIAINIYLIFLTYLYSYTISYIIP